MSKARGAEIRPSTQSESDRQQVLSLFLSRFAGIDQDPTFMLFFNNPDTRYLMVEHERGFPDNSVVARVGNGQHDFALTAGPDNEERRRRGWLGEFYRVRGSRLLEGFEH